MDITGLVIAQPLDAVKVSYSAKDYSIIGYAGFTGFLNSHTVSINAAPNENSASEIYALAAPFVVVNTMFAAPQLFAGQDLFAEVVATIDVAENADNRVYTNLALSGALMDSYYYTFASSIAATQNADSKWGVSNMSSFEITTFFPYGYSMLSLKTVFATSDDNGGFKSFSTTSASLNGSVPYAGHLKTGLVATMRPLDNVLFLFAPDCLFNVMSSDSDKGFAGFQWVFNAKYTATSDLAINASVGQFISPVAGEKPYLDASIGLSFLF